MELCGVERIAVVFILVFVFVIVVVVVGVVVDVIRGTRENDPGGNRTGQQ